MDTSNSPRMIASETTPLVPAEAPKPKTPLPKLQLGILMTLQLAEPIASTSIFPYINQLIRELGITGGDDAAVGYYAGIIESLFFVGQALTVLRWTRLSDRIGRKPVLVIGLSGTCISMLCFGLSTTFWSLVIRLMGELTDSTNMAQAFSLLLIVWSLGGFIGPLIGGTLARPQDHWPTLFANPFWGEIPILSALRSGRLSALSGPFHDGIPFRRGRSYIPVALHTALVPLFFSTPTYLGGLGFDPSSIGSWLAFSGIMDGVFQTLLFAKLVDWLGPKRLFFVSVSSYAVLMVVLPIMSWLVHARGGVDYTVTFALLCQLVLLVMWGMGFGTVFMFITASAPTKNVLGAINGLGQTSASMARAFGPALATSLFSASKEHNLLGGNAVFVVLLVLAGVLRWLGSWLPDEIQDRDE
ncbi:major facilitator superfamily domain-containing protein [Suillus lakei]|nr:major facilitator superfamily domain-containing protein [Suillus lakei]